MSDSSSSSASFLDSALDDPMNSEETILTGNPFATAISLFLFQVALIVALSRLLSHFLGRIKLPSVVTEMIGGILLGPTALGKIPGFSDLIFPEDSIHVIRVISQFGLVVFMFLVGCELDTSQFGANVKTITGIAAVGVSFPLLTAIPTSFLFQTSEFSRTSQLSLTLFIGVTIGISALPVLARILRERNMLGTPFGDLVMSASALEDIFAWFLLSIIVAIVRATQPLNILYTIIMAVAEVIILLYLIRPFLLRVLAPVETKDDLTPARFFYIFSVVLLVSYVCEVIGLSNLVGALQVGLIMPRNQVLLVAINDKLEDLIVVILMPVFFTYSGLRTDFTLLNDGRLWGLSILVVVIATVAKIVAISVPVKYFGFSIRQSLAFGVLMSCKGLVALIIVNFGVDYEVITPKLFAILIMMVLFSSIQTVPLAELVLPLNQYAEGHCKKLKTDPATAEDLERSQRVEMVNLKFNPVTDSHYDADGVLAELSDVDGVGKKPKHDREHFRSKSMNRLVIHELEPHDLHSEYGTKHSVEDAGTLKSGHGGASGCALTRFDSTLHIDNMDDVSENDFGSDRYAPVPDELANPIIVIPCSQRSSLTAGSAILNQLADQSYTLKLKPSNSPRIASNFSAVSWTPLVFATSVRSAIAAITIGTHFLHANPTNIDHTANVRAAHSLPLSTGSATAGCSARDTSSASVTPSKHVVVCRPWFPEDLPSAFLRNSVSSMLQRDQVILRLVERSALHRIDLHLAVWPYASDLAAALEASIQEHIPYLLKLNAQNRSHSLIFLDSDLYLTKLIQLGSSATNTTHVQRQQIMNQVDGLTKTQHRNYVLGFDEADRFLLGSNNQELFILTANLVLLTTPTATNSTTATGAGASSNNNSSLDPEVSTISPDSPFTTSAFTSFRLEFNESSEACLNLIRHLSRSGSGSGSGTGTGTRTVLVHILNHSNAAVAEYLQHNSAVTQVKKWIQQKLKMTKLNNVIISPEQNRNPNELNNNEELRSITVKFSVTDQDNINCSRSSDGAPAAATTSFNPDVPPPLVAVSITDSMNPITSLLLWVNNHLMGNQYRIIWLADVQTPGIQFDNRFNTPVTTSGGIGAQLHSQSQNHSEVSSYASLTPESPPRSARPETGSNHNVSDGRAIASSSSASRLSCFELTQQVLELNNHAALLLLHSTAGHPGHHHSQASAQRQDSTVNTPPSTLFTHTLLRCRQF